LTHFIISIARLSKDIIMKIVSNVQLRTKIILVGMFGFGLLQVITPLSLPSVNIVSAQTTSSSSSITSPLSSSGSINDTLTSVEITSPQDGQRVPVGELKIEGTSSDDAKSNCQVYADVNDMTPMQNATASGQGGMNDYSNWTFIYTPEYQVITDGVNELTAKISCFDASSTPVSKYNSVNITGLPSPDTFAAPAPIPSMTG
jgi:hypothetical protein